jgi:phosphate transport system substrate-binding protein
MNCHPERSLARFLRQTQSKDLRLRLLGLALLSLTIASLAQTVPAAPREHAAYILPDGTIQIVTPSALTGVVRALNQLYVSTHPNIKFTVREGDNYSAMAALTFDRTAVAPLGTPFTRIGLGDNLKIAAEPLAFRIAHASLTPAPGATPALGIIVNSANPIAALSLPQLTRIFAVGGPAGDIATWSQAGITGPLADRAIHPAGPLPSDEQASEDPQAGEFLSDRMGGLNMTHTYAAMPRYADIIQRVAEDPAAIGIAALNQPLANVKVIPLRNTDTGPFIAPTAAEIAAGRYPLDRFVYIDLRLGKGLPLDDFARDYMRTVLSEAGQRAIAAEAAGYIPLNAAELAEERAKLDR